MLKVSERTIDRVSKKIGITVFRIGNQLRYPESSVVEMLTTEQISPSERDKIIQSLLGD
ncbi:MAG: hypothetical protein HON37_13715 [Candidatus Marinimicrobia bacterium]|nr:hypothetical protein [Candidatus Neomarinimicrobiota bacterium]MBT4853103.1 hypothetical protein [Candidatus Neomarinimicrobiota bacterium]